LRRCFLIFITFASLFVGLGGAEAEDQEARRIRLNDGRQYDGIVVESSAAGMLLQVPQGRTLISYMALAEISTISMKDFLNQSPIRLGIAPITAATDGLTGLAKHLDQWVLDAARTLPSTEITAASAWQSKVGIDLSACIGDASCLRGMADELNLDYLLVPTITGSIESRLKIGLTSFVASTGATIGAAGIALDLSTDQDPVFIGSEILQGLYTSLGFQPGVDTSTIVIEVFAGRSPTPEPEPEVVEPEPEVVEPEPEVVEPEPEVVEPEPEVAGTEPEVVEPEPEVVEPEPEGVEPEPEVAGTEPKRTPRPIVLSRGKAIALGFAPVPGLVSALEKDKVGFVISIAGTITASWASVYLIGRTARTEAAFWAPAVLLPYAINVAFNQVALLVRAKRAKRLQPGAAPIITIDKTGAASGAGAGLWLSGDF
jgi:hypothetical protein